VRPPIGTAVLVVSVVALLGWNLTHLPAPVHPDGGFPAGDVVARQVDSTLTQRGVDRSRPTRIRSLPDFKSTEALVYPMARLGRSYVADLPKGQRALGSASTPDPAAGLVIMCDQLFRDTIGADCGGPAEDAFAAQNGLSEPPVDRIKAAPTRWVSIYLPAPT
jgi:hypothetical protein